MRGQRRQSGEHKWQRYSDADLVDLAKVDRTAFGSLYDRHRDRITKYCFYRLSSWSDAEDAAHETFLKAFSSLQKFDNQRDAFLPWLFQIAHNDIIDRYRRKKTRPEVPLEAAAFRPDPGPLPDEAAADADAHDRILALLQTLPTDDQRRAIELRVSGLTGSQIAFVLGKNHDAVRQLTCRAVENLHARMTTRSETEVSGG